MRQASLQINAMEYLGKITHQRVYKVPTENTYVFEAAS